VLKCRRYEGEIGVMRGREYSLLRLVAIAEDAVVVGTSLEVADQGNGLVVEGRGKVVGEKVGRESVLEEGAEGSMADFDTAKVAEGIVADGADMAVVAKEDAAEDAAEGAVEGMVDSLDTAAEEVVRASPEQE
jgi:hypothetical protein